MKYLGLAIAVLLTPLFASANEGMFSLKRRSDRLSKNTVIAAIQIKRRRLKVTL